MKRTLSIFAVATALLVGAVFLRGAIEATPAPVPPPKDALAPQAEPLPDTPAPKVQLAILLDTSSSMNGLIDQARTRLWRVVNELAELKRGGRTPELQVAVYEYGNSGLSAQSGYLRRVQALTTDLDKVSEGLFSLTTNGGDEYCGQVIEAALQGLSWSREPDALKMIFIAGNEGFDQGPIDYRAAVKAAQEMNVTVNTVHCGPEATGIAGHWQQAALLAGGRFHTMDQNRALAFLAAPQDDEIARLGAEINKTSLHYGAVGNLGSVNQVAQDQNAAMAGRGSAVQRAISKGSRVYDTSRWDLVSAIHRKKAKIAHIDKKLLSAKYAQLSDQALTHEVEKLQKRRDYLQNRLGTLKVQRKAYVAAKRNALHKAGQAGGTGPNSLDSSMINTIKQQAMRARYKVASAPSAG